MHCEHGITTGVVCNRCIEKEKRESGCASVSRTITLSENVRQESPVGFMVFAYGSIDVDYMVFPEEREARDYAMDQEEKAKAPEGSWPIYALWASEWPKY